MKIVGERPCWAISQPPCEISQGVANCLKWNPRDFCCWSISQGPAKFRRALRNGYASSFGEISSAQVRNGLRNGCSTLQACLSSIFLAKWHVKRSQKLISHAYHLELGVGMPSMLFSLLAELISSLN